MGLFEIIVIAVGLSMDAFAVSVMLGLSVQKPRLKEVLLPGVYFGFFQALMPLAGFFAGTHFAKKVEELGPWVAFVLLGFIGGKMIKDSFSKKEEQAEENPFHFTKMLLLAVATSIDALAVGVTFAFFKINIVMAVAITGCTTFFIASCGVVIGNMFGARFKSKAEFIGGFVLVALGIKIVIEHLFF